MFGALFRRLGIRSAAKGYATRLGPQLRADYGAATYYTPAQIRASAARAKLPAAHIRFGYAGFLDEAAFAALGLPDDYAELRSMLHKYAPNRPVSDSFAPLPDGSGMPGASTPNAF